MASFLGRGVRGSDERIHKAWTSRGLSSNFPRTQRGAAQKC